MKEPRAVQGAARGSTTIRQTPSVNHVLLGRKGKAALPGGVEILKLTHVKTVVLVSIGWLEAVPLVQPVLLVNGLLALVQSPLVQTVFLGSIHRTEGEPLHQIVLIVLLVSIKMDQVKQVVSPPEKAISILR